MNIAFPALVVFALLLPGFIARSRIKRVEATTLDYSPFGQTVTEAVIVSGALHILWIWLTKYSTGREFAPEVLFGLFSAEPIAQAESLKTLASQAGEISCYFSTLIVFSILAPWAARYGITKLRLDRDGANFSFLFRFHRAPWYYLFSRSDLEAEEGRDLIAISAIVNVAGTAYLYSGLLEEYFCDQSGNLDRMVLRWVMRRTLDKDKKIAIPLGSDTGESSPQLAGQEVANLGEDSRFYPIDGDYFVLRYSETLTLNFEYLNLDDYLKSRGMSSKIPASSSD